MLELASNLVAGGAPLATPVLFMFSGAEEPLCQVSKRQTTYQHRVRSGDFACTQPSASGARHFHMQGSSDAPQIALNPPQSASAWMHHSKHAGRVGAFINLEALGPGGVPIVFQHSGAWTIHAYARGATHPRGAIFAQVRRPGAGVLLLRQRSAACLRKSHAYSAYPTNR